MSSLNDRVVFIGINSHVLALDRRTGVEVWRTRLKGGFVNLVLSGGDLFAATNGEVFCLDPESGRVRWNNRLKGMGFGIVTVASPAAPIAAAVEQEEIYRARNDGGD